MQLGSRTTLSTIVLGQIVYPHPGTSWSKISASGKLEVVGDTIHLSGRGLFGRFCPVVTLRRDEITRVDREGMMLLRRFGRGFTFRCSRREVDGITFFAYGSRAESLERLVAGFVGEKREG